jgi:hypothetical protein
MDTDVETLLAEEFNRIRGRLCGMIEAVGLPERQERGAVSTLKSLTYDAQERIGSLVEEKMEAR